VILEPSSDAMFPYEFKGYEPGIFSELYLPKVTGYQGKLYETLTEGFDIARVKRVFHEKKASISVLLRRFTEAGELTDERIDALEPLFWGYSMYEVDGVFYNPDKGTIEERTQIIRMMFLPDLEGLHKLNPELAFDDLRRAVRNFLRGDRLEKEALRKSLPNLIDRVANWHANVGLFIFGFLVFQLCERIKELGDSQRRSLEDEIWVCSFWTLSVNRVKLQI